MSASSRERSGGRRVAVTGMGAVSAAGIGLASLEQACAEARCALRPIVDIPTERLGVKFAGQVPGYDPVSHFDSKRVAFLDRTSQLALVAAREAMSTAALAIVAPRRAGVIFGASIGHETIDACYKTFYADNINRLHPFSIPRIMPNGPASQISMEFGLRGPSYATSSACASSTHAIGLAFHAIRSGQIDVALTGGSDAPICVGVLKGWEALRVLSPDVCRPFSKDRTGLAVGEGAGVLVLEAMDHATARGASVLGEIVGFGMSADAADITAPDAEGAAYAITSALDDAELALADVGYINAHGTGTRLNDKTEAAAIRAVFGAHADRLAVSSTKSILGHTLCAGGALELIASLAMMRRGLLPPTVNWREADPECDLDCIPNAPRTADVEFALSNSFAFGGLNAVLAIRR